MERRTKKGFVEETIFGLKICRWKKIRKDISSAEIRVGKGWRQRSVREPLEVPLVWLEEWVLHILTSSANKTL